MRIDRWTGSRSGNRKVQFARGILSSRVPPEGEKVFLPFRVRDFHRYFYLHRPRASYYLSLIEHFNTVLRRFDSESVSLETSPCRSTIVTTNWKKQFTCLVVNIYATTEKKKSITVHREINIVQHGTARISFIKFYIR